MECTGFSVLLTSAFDSSKLKPAQWPNRESMVTVYEFEFYTEDFEGGHMLDGTFYPARKASCILAKPGQKMRTVFPYKSYCFNIFTRDPELCALLDQLPTAFSLWNMETVLEPLRQMIMLRPAQSLNQRLLVQSYACQILSALSHYRQADEAAVRSVAKHRAALINVGCYIRENLSGDLSLEVLAKQCNMAPNYFHRIFKAAFGRSPAKLVEQYRIDDAKRELVSSDLPLDELAAKCGFSSQSYFCSRFKKVTGKTPVQYRDEILSRLDQDSGI